MKNPILNLQKKKTSELISTIQNSLKHNPKDFKLYFKLGNLFKKIGDIDNAIKHYQLTLSINPNFIQAAKNQAIAHAMKGEYSRALSIFMKLEENNQNKKETCYYIASIYAKQNNINKSITWLKSAISNGYDNWERIKTDINLENIRHTAYYDNIISNKN